MGAHFLKAARTMWKVILVTGGNKGIGLAIVEALLQEVEDSIVLLGSRDAARGRQAVDQVVGKLGKQFQPRLQPVLFAAGLGERSEGSWGEYGLAKAAVNC